MLFPSSLIQPKSKEEYDKNQRKKMLFPPSLIQPKSKEYEKINKIKKEMQKNFFFQLPLFHRCNKSSPVQRNSSSASAQTGLNCGNYDNDDDDNGDVVRFPNCIVYSWVYNTQKTVKFDFDCFHSLH